MKIINFDQGSKEWLSWRKTVITATDCPAILGSSPWVSEYQCWQKKLGLVEEKPINEAMERGMRLEPIARNKFIKEFGIKMTPRVVESSEFDFLGASLDGLSDDNKYVLEVKCGGKKLHDMALQGVLPDYYMDQIQHQLFVTKAEKCFYYSYDGKEGICIEVLPDPNFAEKFMPKARMFWKRVALCESPPMREDDYQDMDSNIEWQECSRQYQEADKLIKALEEKKDMMRKKLIGLCADQSCVGSGIKVLKTVMKGRISYDEIPEIKCIDLEKYRKNAITTWKVLVA